MAFVANQTDEEDQKVNNPSQGTVAPSGGGVHLAPTSGLVSGSGGGGSGGASSKPMGGQFASLNQYVNANTPNAGALTDQVIAPINQQAQDMGNQATQTLTDVQKQVDSGYTKQNQGLLDQAGQDIVSFSKDPNNVKAFQGQLTDQYTGPQSVEGTTPYQTIIGNLNNTISSGKSLTGTTAGQQQLLKNVEQNPGNTGVTSLNEAILSSNPDYLSKVQNSYQPFQSLLGTLQSGAQNIDTSISKAQQEAQSANQASNNLINTDINNLNTGIQGRLTAAQKAAQYLNQSIASDVAHKNFSQADLSATGMTKDQWNSILSGINKANTKQFVASPLSGNGSAYTTPYDINDQILKGYLTQQDPTQVINAGNVANTNDYAQAQAFQTLLNGLNTQAPQVIIDPSQASQAGTAPTNLSQFNFQQLGQDVNQLNAEQYQQALAQANNIANAQQAQHDASKGGGFMGLLQQAAPWIANAPLKLAQTSLQAAKNKAGN